MTNETTNRPAAIQSIGEALASADATAEKAYVPVFLRMQEEQVTVEEIAGKGEFFDAFRDGILIGWQGTEFAAEFGRVNGKALLAGKVLNRATLRMITVEKPKATWQRELSSKVAKLRDLYASFIAPNGEAEPNGEAKGKGAGKSGQNRTGLLGQVAKTCAAWSVRMQKVADGTSQNGQDKQIEADLTELRALLDKAAALALELNK